MIGVGEITHYLGDAVCPGVRRETRRRWRRPRSW